MLPRCRDLCGCLFLCWSFRVGLSIRSWCLLGGEMALQKYPLFLLKLQCVFEHLGGGPDGPEICRVAVCEFGSPEEADDPIPSVKLDFNTPSPPNTVTTVIIASQHCKHLPNQTLNSSRLYALSDALNASALLLFLIPNTSYRLGPGQSMLTPHCHCPQRQCNA